MKQTLAITIALTLLAPLSLAQREQRRPLPEARPDSVEQNLDHQRSRARRTRTDSAERREAGRERASCPSCERPKPAERSRGAGSEARESRRSSRQLERPGRRDRLGRGDAQRPQESPEIEALRERIRELREKREALLREMDPERRSKRARPRRGRGR